MFIRIFEGVSSINSERCVTRFLDPRCIRCSDCVSCFSAEGGDEGGDGAARLPAEAFG